MQPPSRPEIPPIDGEDLAAKLHKVTTEATTLLSGSCCSIQLSSMSPGKFAEDKPYMLQVAYLIQDAALAMPALKLSGTSPF